jgi:hypothetical protein
MNLLGIHPRGKSAVKYFALLHQGEIMIDDMFDSILTPKNCQENVALIASQQLVDGKLYHSIFSESSWSYQSVGDDIKLVVVTHPRLSQRQRLGLISQLVSYLQEYQNYYNRTKRDDILGGIKPEMIKIIQKLNKNTNVEGLDDLETELKRESNKQEKFKDEEYNPKDKKQQLSAPLTEELKFEEPIDPKIVMPKQFVVDVAEPKYTLKNDLKDDEKQEKPKKKGFFKSLFGI